MARIKAAALFLVFLAMGAGLISTAVSEYDGSDPAGTVVVLLFGLIMLVGAGATFWIMLLPALRDEDRSLKDEVTEMVRADQTGAPDADAADRLLSSFRASLAAFFASPGTPENSSLQSTATQLHWHILYLQKRRMDRKGITMEFRAERKRYDGVSVEKRTFFDGKYAITDVGERISALRIYRRGSRTVHRRRDTETAHYRILTPGRAPGTGQILCPGCGRAASRDNLLDGCDYCGTKFTVEDLGPRVSSFGLRREYAVAYDKYRDSRRYYGVRAFLAGAVPVFLLSLIGMLSVRGELDTGPVMQAVAIFFGAAFCGAAAGFLLSLLFWFVIFPLLQARQSLAYRTGKKREERKRAASRNDELERKIRTFDPLFSLEGFFSGLQNKLAAIHYAERPEEFRAFADAPLDALAAACRDVVDLDVTELSLTDYHTDETMQHIEVRAEADLLLAEPSRVFRRSERLLLSLEKSAACKTEAVCGPSVLRCRGCGASLSLLEGGTCRYCGGRLNLRDHDWVIVRCRAEPG